MDKLLPTLNSSEVDTEYVLYTDTDVLFFNDFTECSLPKPAILYMGPENIRKKINNSGVLYMNVSAMREHLPRMMALAAAHRWKFAANDQGLYLEYFRKQNYATLLPDKYNWKGYWGGADDVVIAHFHGPKPGSCLECLLLYRTQVDLCTRCEPYQALTRTLPDNGKFYETMLMTYRNYSKSAHNDYSVVATSA